MVALRQWMKGARDPAGDDLDRGRRSRRPHTQNTRVNPWICRAFRIGTLMAPAGPRRKIGENASSKRGDVNSFGAGIGPGRRRAPGLFPDVSITAAMRPSMVET